MKKIILFIVLINFTTLFPQGISGNHAQGVFIAVAVGPRIPINYFANSSDLGYGFNVEVSYTNDAYLPVFVYGKIGFDQFPGSQQFYEVTDYSNYSTNALPLSLGLRYYFPPLVENVVLFMPIVEASADYVYFQKLHQFKPASGKSNYLEDVSKFGFTAGVGLSMFMLEIVASYHYVKTNQFISLDLRIRLPLYISL